MARLGIWCGRQRWYIFPTVVISWHWHDRAGPETSERIIGLEVGADDYVTKPFEPRELLARVRSVLRRLEAAGPVVSEGFAVFEFEGWHIDIVARRLTSPEQNPVVLSSGEFNLLRTLLENPNQIVSRDRILDFTHDHDAPVFDRSVDVQVARLRRKIERDPQHPELIKTVRNGGYLLFATDSGSTWTMILTMPGGKSFIIGAGQDWSDLRHLVSGTKI